MATRAILDDDVFKMLVAERKRLRIDRYDEVWEGMYVMPTVPNTDHQQLADDLGDILTAVVKQPGLGSKFQGLNISDRRKGWKQNYRVPDLVVVLKNSRAIDCGSFWYSGPDFLVEVESPGDDTEEKIPFYSKIGVRELLILHRDRRTLRLLRHDGEDLVEVKSELLEGKQWLKSAVVNLAFRRNGSKTAPRTEVRRTDGEPGNWIV